MLTNKINSLLETSVITESPRNYLGASSIGHPCDRNLKYRLLHLRGTPVNRQTIRRFNVGHTLESMILSELRDVGFDISASENFEIEDLNIKGHCDGIIEAVPDDTIKVPCVLEIKTMSTFTFRKLKKIGIQELSRQYYTQMQLYMAFTREGTLRDNPGIFCIINKDNQEIYFEAIEFDPDLVDETLERIEDISATAMPAKMKDPDWHCQYCEFNSMCESHGN